MRTLGLGRRFKPVGYFFEAFFTRGLVHARGHIGVLISFVGNCGLQILKRRANRQAGGWIAYPLQVFRMTVRMSCFSFSGETEQCSNAVLSLDVRLVCEVQVAAVSL